MSRWLIEFTNHPFWKHWDGVKDLSSTLTVDDTSIAANVEELARLKKAVLFISNMIDSIDPELVPVNTWANFQNQCAPLLSEMKAYSSNRNIGHLRNANNNHLDNLLSYLRPYLADSTKAMRANAK